MMGLTHVLFLALDNYLPVRLALALREGGQHSLTATVRKVGVAVCCFTAVVSAILAAAPKFWLQLVYGSELAKYSVVLQWFCVVYILISLNTVVRHALRSIEVTRPIFLSYLVVAVFSITLAYPMVSNLGIRGVMVGLVAGQLISLAYCSYYLWGALR
jgi:O-antigen/teichoic acid export membrane protein